MKKNTDFISVILFRSLNLVKNNIDAVFRSVKIPVSKFWL